MWEADGSPCCAVAEDSRTFYQSEMTISKTFAQVVSSCGTSTARLIRIRAVDGNEHAARNGILPDLQVRSRGSYRASATPGIRPKRIDLPQITCRLR
jgi:hypothetical protein